MMSNTDKLENLRDSIINARLKYEDEDTDLRFARPKQVQAINIALRQIVPEAKKRAQRIALLASVCGREPRYFRSSKDLLFEEASALIDRLYETDGAEESLSTAHLRPEVADAIRYAWRELIGEEGSSCTPSGSASSAI